MLFAFQDFFISVLWSTASVILIFSSSIVDNFFKFQADENDVEAYQEDEYDTVLLAVGRTALTEQLGLKEAGVHFNPRTMKVFSDNEQTNVPNIYAVGDVLEVRVTCIYSFFWKKAQF